MDGFCHDCGPFRVPMGAFWALGASIWEFLDACSEPWDTSCDFSATFLYLRVAFLIPSPPQAHPYSSLKKYIFVFCGPCPLALFPNLCGNRWVKLSFLNVLVDQS